MPLITFTSPEYKDKTVYAIAGSFTETVLKIAKQNKISMSFDCENGECGSCLIHVTYLESGAPKGYHLEKNEKHVLREIGKVSAVELERMIVDDIPCEWRLACHLIPKDIVVVY